jgi:transposase
MLFSRNQHLEGAFMEGILLGHRDKFQVEIIYKVYSGQLSRVDAQRMLGISGRTLRRHLKSFKSDGIAFVVHGNKKRAPKNKSAVALKEDIQDLVKERYFDFNMLHALEKIKEEYGITLKRETFRKWMHEIGMVKRSKRRRTKARFARTRMSQAGLLTLMDGSYHRWFGDEDSCLIAIMDDATSDILYAEFCDHETSAMCLRVLRKAIESRGLFKSLYVDQAGVYGGIKRQAFGQVTRALEELGVQVIFANSPEAKGRVERLFQTLQDRLIPEMRLKGIKTREEANMYLQEIYIPHLYRPRFTVEAENKVSAFVPIHAAYDLKKVLCLKEYRVVARDHTFSLGAERYLIVEPIKYSIHKHRIEIIWNEQGTEWQAYFAGKPLKVARFTRAKPKAA